MMSKLLNALSCRGKRANLKLINFHISNMLNEPVESIEFGVRDMKRERR